MHKFGLSLLMCVLSAHFTLAQTLVINEISSENFSNSFDEDGDSSDWFEVYNYGDNDVQLENWGVSDDLEEPFKWVFPEVEIEADEILVVWASGKDRVEGELHTNFSLDAESESLVIVNAEGDVIDEVVEFSCTEDRSWGRLPDGEQWRTLENVSWSSSNEINDVAFSSEGSGFYEEGFELSLNSVMGDEIYYTLNGEEPGIGDILYEGPISINDRDGDPNHFCNFPTTPDFETGYPIWEDPEVLLDKATVLRFCTFRDGVKTGRVETRTFFIDDEFTLPVLSIVSNEEGLFSDETGIYVPGNSFNPDELYSSGNYFKRGENWEREAHIDMFNEYGEHVLESDCGIRIHGGYSRISSLKSMKFYARSEYGDKYFDYQLMPQSENDRYKRFMIRTPMSDWGNTVIKDELSHVISEDLDFPNLNSQPVVVFLNGEYWGVLSIRDRIDKYYLEYEEGADRDSVNLVLGGWGLFPEEGSADEMLDLRDWIESNGLVEDENLEYVETIMDVDNYIDYCIAQMFVANYDWPGNNVRLWSPTNGEGRWRWIFYDIDGGFGNHKTNIFEHCMEDDPEVVWPNSAHSTFMFRHLITNEGFVERFTERWASVLLDDFSTSRLLSLTSEVKNKYTLEMSQHIERWKYPESVEQWENEVDNTLADFFEKRPCVIEEQIIEFFNLEHFKFSCEDMPEIGTLLLFPSPNDGNFQVLNNSFATIRGDLVITDLSGATVFKKTQVYLDGFQTYSISSNNLSPGMYILNFRGLEFNQGLKFVVE